jgi:hypothetical protein
MKWAIFYEQVYGGSQNRKPKGETMKMVSAVEGYICD